MAALNTVTFHWLHYTPSVTTRVAAVGRRPAQIPHPRHQRNSTTRYIIDCHSRVSRVNGYRYTGACCSVYNNKVLLGIFWRPNVAILNSAVHPQTIALNRGTPLRQRMPGRGSLRCMQHQWLREVQATDIRLQRIQCFSSLETLKSSLKFYFTDILTPRIPPSNGLVAFRVCLLCSSFWQMNWLCSIVVCINEEEDKISHNQSYLLLRRRAP